MVFMNSNLLLNLKRPQRSAPLCQSMCLSKLFVLSYSSFSPTPSASKAFMSSKEKGRGSWRGRGRGGGDSKTSVIFEVSLSLSEEHCADWHRVECYIEAFSLLIAKGRGPAPHPGQPLCPRLEQPQNYNHCARGEKCPLHHPLYRYELLFPDEEGVAINLKLKFILETLMHLSRNLPHMPPSSMYFTKLCSSLQGIYTQLSLLVPTKEEEVSPEDIFANRENYYLKKYVCFFAIPHLRLLLLQYVSTCIGSQALALKHEQHMRVQKGLMRFCCVIRLKEDNLVAAFRDMCSNNCDAMNDFGNTIDLHCQKVVESAAITEASRSKIQLQLHDIATSLWGNEETKVFLDPFGSSQNSLGSTTSDVDFCLHFGTSYNGDSDKYISQQLESSSASTNTSNIPNIVDHSTSPVYDNDRDDENDNSEDNEDNENNDDNSVNTKKDPFNDFSKAGAISFLSTLDDTIRNHVQLSEQFEITRMVDSARVPVLKMLHIESNINIDICYRNMLALENTRLLRLYSSYDPRVRPLMILIKQWTNRRKINDSTNSFPTSYAWNLIVIYFLQVHCVIPYLFIDDDKERFTHWDMGQNGLRNLKNSSLGELAIEFFIFFGTAGKYLFDEFCEMIRVARMKPHSLKSCGLKIANNIAYLNRMVEQHLPSSIEEVEMFQVYWGDIHSGDFKPFNRKGKNGPSPVAVEAGVPFRICIEDPLEDHDLGRVVHNQKASILMATEFRRTISIIMRHIKDDRGDSVLQELLLPTEESAIIILPFLCKICGGTHNTRDCEMMCCERCLSTTHMRRNCDVCIICKQVGHFARDCPHKRRSKGNWSKDRAKQR